MTLSTELIDQGWKKEDRPVGNSRMGKKMIRPTIFRGEHGSACYLLPDGWICREGCTVEDMQQASSYCVVVDRLIEIIPETKRIWFRVHWTLSRESHRQKFLNGRSRFPQDEIINIKIWHRGKTWTKIGARRQMKKLSEPPA